MQPLRAAFGGFDGERLNRVRFEEFTRLLRLLGPLAYLRTRRDDEQRQVIAAATANSNNLRVIRGIAIVINCVTYPFKCGGCARRGARW